MIEQVFQMSGSQAHVIEAVIKDENSDACGFSEPAHITVSSP